MKRYSFILISVAVIFTACGKPAETKTSDQPKSDPSQVTISNKITTGDWDYVAIKKTVLEVFPEAYPEFFEVTFSDWGDKAYPTSASFCVPDKYFPAPLTEDELDKRAKLLTEKFKYQGCEGISIGESSEYSYGDWEEKKVRRLTFNFGIGC